MAKKAFLVGINDYAPVGPGGPDLGGCINDVRNMAKTLSLLEIVPANPSSMRICTNSCATKANILDGLSWLVKGAKKGDLLIFYYSGHGSQVVDISRDEIDRKDECICPHDFETSGVIIDDDLGKIFQGIPSGVNLEVILDACHSGTGTREMAAMAALPQEQQVTIRYIEPPLDWGFFIDEDPTLPLRGFLKERKGTEYQKEPVLANINHVLWAACRDNQTAGEGNIGGKIQGYFTYCFCKILRRTNAKITRSKLDRLVAGCLKQLGVAQIPQLEGTRDIFKEQVFT